MTAPAQAGAAPSRYRSLSLLSRREFELLVDAIGLSIVDSLEPLLEDERGRFEAMVVLNAHLCSMIIDAADPAAALRECVSTLLGMVKSQMLRRANGDKL